MHRRYTVERLERADQHRGRTSLLLGHDVDQPVNSVIQIDVRKARRTIERTVTSGRPRRGVARWIAFADVRLDFDDDAGGDGAAAVMDQDLTEQIAGDVQRRTIVKGSRQLQDAASILYHA